MCDFFSGRVRSKMIVGMDPIPYNEDERLEVLKNSKLIEDPNLDDEIHRYCEIAVRIFDVSSSNFRYTFPENDPNLVSNYLGSGCIF